MKRGFLAQGHIGRVAVDGSGGGKDDAPHLVATGGLRDREGGAKVEAKIFDGILQAFRHAHEGGQVKDGVGLGLGHHRVTRVGIGDVNGDQTKGGMIGEGVEVFLPARAEIVGTHDAVSARHESFAGVTADESGGAGDEDGGHGG